MTIRFLYAATIATLCAVILTFCAPHPATAQPAATASGAYINCAQVAADVSLAARAMKRGHLGPSWEVRAAADWYTRVVVGHAKQALSTDNPAQYVRDLHKACLLETA